MTKPELYVHVRMATHFLRWELPEFSKYFTIVRQPSRYTALLSFGPDALEEASRLPASQRFAVLFPGFSQNPVHDLATRVRHLALIQKSFSQVFINPGPLEIAYASLGNVSLYPFSVDMNLVGIRNFRDQLESLVHVSHDNPQKDWQRSESIMRKTGLKYEVFPPRDNASLASHVAAIDRRNKWRTSLGLPARKRLPVGYFDHPSTVAKYQEYDGFVHVARDVKHNEFIDGKYTASLIEAGVTGAILFWHDTWGLGNGLETVFNLPLETRQAADMILDIRRSIDVAEHSRRTREEMLDTFNPQNSVRTRAMRILEFLSS